MSDQIQATPSNSVIDAIIAALRSGKQKLTDLPIIGEKGSPLHKAAPEFLVPETGLNELQNWSEGNLPMEIPQGNNIPRFKHNRASDVLDAAGLLPTGAALKGSKAAALAALYPGSLRKDLIASTATNAANLIKYGNLTHELTHPSLAVTKGQISPFDARDLVLVMREGALDPKVASTTLHAFDAFTPRRNQAVANPETFRGDMEYYVRNYKDQPERFAKVTQELLRDYANKRLVDRFYPVWKKGGVMTEGNKIPSVTALPKLYSGRGAFNSVGKQPGTGTALQEFSYGPRFQSFKHYEESPYGAARLEDGFNQDDVYNKLKSLFPGRNLDEALIHSALMGSQGRDKIPELHKLLQELRRTKSDYGELKAFGPVGLHPGNFAGAIVNDPHSYSAQRVADALRKRGLQVENAASTPEETFDIAEWMSRGEKSTKTIVPVTKPASWSPSGFDTIPVAEATEISEDFAKANPAIAQLVKQLKQEDAITELTSKQFSQLQAVFGHAGAQDFAKKLFDPNAELSDFSDNDIQLMMDLGLQSTPTGKKLSAMFE